MGPADPFPPQGTQTPGLPTFHFYFPGCKMPLAIRSGGVLFFFPLIFTHKMCISRTKAAMMDPLVLANFLSVLSRNSCAGLFTINTFLLKRRAVCRSRHNNGSCNKVGLVGFLGCFFCLFCNQNYFKDSPLSFSSLLQRITFSPLINYV